MYITATISVFFFGLALIQGQMDEDPECRPPHPPGKEGECCAAPDFFKVPDNMYDVLHKCHEEYDMKRPPHPPGPPGSGTPPSAEEIAAHMSARECAHECVFKEMKFIKSDGGLDSDALKAAVTKMYTGDWADAASTAIDKCITSAKGEVSETAKCKSGASQLSKCFLRTTFLNCPASAWTESTECAAAKARLNKCPNAFIPMHPPKH